MKLKLKGSRTRPALLTAGTALAAAAVLLGAAGASAGIFRPPVDYPTGNGPRSVAVGDLNGDGKADLAVANVGSNTLSVLLGNGDGSFQAKTA